MSLAYVCLSIFPVSLSLSRSLSLSLSVPRLIPHRVSVSPKVTTVTAFRSKIFTLLFFECFFIAFFHLSIHFQKNPVTFGNPGFACSFASMLCLCSFLAGSLRIWFQAVCVPRKIFPVRSLLFKRGGGGLTLGCPFPIKLTFSLLLLIRFSNCEAIRAAFSKCI